MPEVRRRLGESGTLMRAFVPLKTSPPPKRPAAVQVAFWIVPVLPEPDASATVVPVPSPNEYAATGLWASAGPAARAMLRPTATMNETARRRRADVADARSMPSRATSRAKNVIYRGTLSMQEHRLSSLQRF